MVKGFKKLTTRNLKNNEQILLGKNMVYQNMKMYQQLKHMIGLSIDFGGVPSCLEGYTDAPNTRDFFFLLQENNLFWH